jgi:hypothetical protein
MDSSSETSTSSSIGEDHCSFNATTLIVLKHQQRVNLKTKGMPLTAFEKKLFSANS